MDNGFQLVDFKIKEFNRDSTQIELSFDAVTGNVYKQYGNDVFLKNISFSLQEIEKPEERKLPVQIDFPVHKIDTIIYEIPEGYRLSKKLEPKIIASRYGEYRYNIREEDGKVIATKEVLINSGFYAVSEYHDFYSFYNQVVEFDNKTVIILYK